MFSTPILFLIFNRPDNTHKVFDEIRKAKPTKLYIAADGPRDGNERDIQLCKETRHIVSFIDWECEVKTLFREGNLGCKRAVSSSIDWFFEQEPEGIILEDDCLPTESFFSFCADILQKYRDDERIMVVSGDNFHPEIFDTPYSYYFSNYANIWGWATWRRAWSHYDVEMKLWPEIKHHKFHHMFSENQMMRHFWEMIFQDVHDGLIDTWDYQWNFACKVNNGLTIIPRKNLITNIGVGAGSTHTDDSILNLGFLRTEELEFPLKHPPYVIPDKVADDKLVTLHYKHLRRYRYRYMIKKKLPAKLVAILKKMKQ